MALKSLILDLDGTLIDSVPAVTAAVNVVLAEGGRAQLSVDEVMGMVGRGALATLEEALDATGGRVDGEADALMGRYLEAYLDDPAASTVIYPHVVEVLSALHGGGVKLGICTNKPGATTRPVLDALGLSELFSAVVTADDTAFPKPNGRHILETLAIMDCDAAGAVYVGDSETDMAAANDAEIPAVFVTYGYCHVEHGRLNAQAMIDDFGDLPRVLEDLS
ncbi:MAG: HAD-IA family hydrolase [Alphaproteobacteria bacterium]